MSEARTPEEETIRPGDPSEKRAAEQGEEHRGLDPEEDPKGDKSNEEQGA